MDPRTNPYSPGAGYPPPEFADRAEILERADIAIDRIRSRKPARSVILYGLRGVGKTVLLNKIALDAEAESMFIARIEAPEGRSLSSFLVPAMRSTILKINRSEVLKERLARTLKILGGFASALKLKYNMMTLKSGSILEECQAQLTAAI
jgi:hypothetical protein